MRSVASLLVLVALTLSAQSALERAVTLTREKRFDEAAKLIEGVPEPQPIAQRIAFHRLRAAIHSGLREDAAAAQEMRAALALAPTDVNLLLATTVAESQAGDFKNAMSHALKLPEDGRLRLASQWIVGQQFRPAIELMEKSETAFPHSAKLRTVLGIANYAEGQFQDAEKALEEAISLDHSMQAAYLCLARIVLQSSAVPSASVVRSLCTWNELVCAALNLRVARESGDKALMRKSVERLKQSSADNAIARCELARGLEWSGDLEGARKQMETCVELDPLPQNHYRLALLYSKLGMSDLAHKELQARSEMLQKMSEQSALGMSALQSLSSGPK